MKKIKIACVVEVVIDADAQLVKHFDATGEVTDAMKLSALRAECKLQETLNAHAKRLRAVVGADIGTFEIREVQSWE